MLNTIFMVLILYNNQCGIYAIYLKTGQYIECTHATILSVTDKVIARVYAMASKDIIRN